MPHIPTCRTTGAIRGLVSRRWREWRLPGVAPEQIRLLQIASGNWHVGQRRVTWLVFDGRRRNPILACKCALSGTSTPLANEFHALQSLFGRQRSLGFVVPEPLALDEGSEGTLLVQRCLPGAPLHSVMTPAYHGLPGGPIAHGLKLTGWCVRSLRELSGDQTPIAAGEHPRTRSLLERLESVRRLGGLDRWCQLTNERLASTLADLKLPHPWCAHGDLTSDHLLVDGNIWGVIDWEGYTMDGFPYGDLVQYCLTLSQYFRGVDVDLVARALFEEEGAGQDDIIGAIQASRSGVLEGLDISRTDTRAWMALSVLDSILVGKSAALQAGAREPEWGSLMDRTLAALGISPPAVSPSTLPRVSLVVVAHNAAEQVGPCLESLRTQDYPRSRREFLLVHSACPDGTREAFEAWRDGPGAAEIVSILPNPKRILATGWNVALTAARGDVIVRLDAHARAEPGFLRRNIDILTAREESIVGGMRPSLVPTKPGGLLLWMAERSIFGAGQAAYRRRTTPGYVDTLAHAAYHRRVFETVGGYDERLGRTEDNEIHGRMKLAGFKFYFDPSIVSRHLARPTFRAIVRQKLLNGYWVALTLPVAPQCFSPRHFVPGVFVLALLGAGVLAASGVGWPLFALAGSYGLCAIVAATIEGIRAGGTGGVVLAPVLPFIFLSIHLANGLGILGGLVAMPGKWRRWRGYKIPRPMKPKQEGERPGE